MAKTKKLKQAKIKKKRWFPVLSPKFLGEKPIGESFLQEAAEAKGRSLTVNLMAITGDIKNQSSVVKFEINEAQDNKLQTRIKAYTYSPSSIKRFVRRRLTRIDDSVVFETKDKLKVRVKPLLLTRSRVTRNLEYALRMAMRKELKRLVNNATYDEIFGLVVNYRIQKELKEKLSKLYPVKVFEIRMLSEEKRGKLAEVADIEEPAPAEETEEEEESEKPRKKEKVPEDELPPELLEEKEEKPKKS